MQKAIISEDLTIEGNLTARHSSHSRSSGGPRATSRPAPSMCRPRATSPAPSRPRRSPTAAASRAPGHLPSTSRQRNLRGWSPISSRASAHPARAPCSPATCRSRARSKVPPPRAEVARLKSVTGHGRSPRPDGPCGSASPILLALVARPSGRRVGGRCRTGHRRRGSRTMSSAELEIQRRGCAAAPTSEEVLFPHRQRVPGAAFTPTPIALTEMEGAGDGTKRDRRRPEQPRRQERRRRRRWPRPSETARRQGLPPHLRHQRLIASDACFADTGSPPTGR